MRRTLAVLALFAAACQTNPSSSTAAFSEADAEAIRAVLADQQAAWNAGDIPGFMERGYVPTEALTFTSGGTLRRGYAATLKRYQERYADRAAMGRLSFTDLEVSGTGAKSALVIGRWALERDAEPVGGIFSLVVVKRPEGWRILHDHTSVSVPPAPE